jgi:hypothetical protein
MKLEIYHRVPKLPATDYYPEDLISHKHSHNVFLYVNVVISLAPVLVHSVSLGFYIQSTVCSSYLH